MRLYINDISYNFQVVHPNPEILVNDFIAVSDSAANYLFEGIVMPDDYKTRQIVQNFSFITYQGTAHFKDVTNERFKSLLANRLIKMSTDGLDEKIQYVYYNQTESDFIKKAFNRNVPVVSFRTDNVFEHHTLGIINEYFDSAEQSIATNEEVRNISHIGHIAFHQHYFNDQAFRIARQRGKWNPKTNPIPREVATRAYMLESTFDEQWANADVNFRVKLANEVGTFIAELNGWEYKPKLTKRNQRTIFKSLNQSFYLSIDTFHGTFELHDRHGEHLGEYNFYGEKLGESQHKHDIIV